MAAGHVFTLGKPVHAGGDTEMKGTERSGSEAGMIFLHSYPVSRPEKELKLNIRNAYLSAAQEDTALALGYGTVMHEILSGIRIPDHIESTVDKAWSAGKISLQEKERFTTLLTARLGTGVPATWFDRSRMIRTEQDLAIPGKGVLRPDRVIYFDDFIAVVDYKFGMKTDDSHFRQVRQYMKAVNEIEKRDVKGYVWYFTIDRIEEVHP